jgi:O-antigen/teichoic acid export membrane protein
MLSVGVVYAVIWPIVIIRLFRRDPRRSPYSWSITGALPEVGSLLLVTASASQLWPAFLQDILDPWILIGGGSLLVGLGIAATILKLRSKLPAQHDHQL